MIVMYSIGNTPFSRARFNRLPCVVAFGSILRRADVIIAENVNGVKEKHLTNQKRGVIITTDKNKKVTACFLRTGQIFLFVLGNYDEK